MDKKLSDLFQQWLAAFEAMQVASSEAERGEGASYARRNRSQDGRHARRGNGRACRQARTTLVLERTCRCGERPIGLGLSRPRALTGQNPAVEIAKRFEKKAA
jgi:hypothetical protein